VVLWTVGWLAGSRAGGVSLAAGLLTVVSLHAGRPALRTVGLMAVGAWLSAMALLILAALHYAHAPGYETASNPVRAQLAQLGKDAEYRLPGTIAAWRIFRESPWLGSGLGTYGELYSQAMHRVPISYFAHNDYAQWLAETGMVGAGAASVFFILLVVRLRRQWPQWGSEDHTLATGLLGALIAIGLHSVFDWNLHVPANALLFAVVVGLAMALGGPRAKSSADSPARPRSGFNGMARAAIGLAALLWIPLAILAPRAERSMAPLRWAVAMQRAKDGEISEGQKLAMLRQSLPGAEWASRMAPLDAGYAETLGQAYLHLSQGRPSGELDRACREFRRSARLCPANDAVWSTLVRTGWSKQKGTMNRENDKKTRPVGANR